MTTETILAIATPVGTLIGALAGIGSGYYLSMRGKREEWKKEYREKRLSPIIDYTNKYMEFEGRRLRAIMRQQECRKQLEKTADEKEHAEINKVIMQAQEAEHEALKDINALNELEMWHGHLVAMYIDKKLLALFEKWHSFNILQSTREDYHRRMEIATQILNRVDELVIKGWKLPKVKS